MAQREMHPSRLLVIFVEKLQFGYSRSKFELKACNTVQVTTVIGRLLQSDR